MAFFHAVLEFHRSGVYETYDKGLTLKTEKCCTFLKVGHNDHVLWG